MQNWKRRQREAARSTWSRRRRGAVCPQGIFQLTLLELLRRGNAVKKIPSTQKLEKFWVLEKKVLDPAQTGRTQMEFQRWQTRAKHWKRPRSWRPPAEHWQAPALENPIPHGFGGPGPGSPEQIPAAVGRRSFRLTDRWSASSYQTDRTPGLRSYR